MAFSIRRTVFISYSSDAEDFAHAIASRLRSLEYVVFLDSWDLKPSRPYDAHLEERVRSCSLFIFAVSPRSVLPESYAKTELGWAVASRRRILGVFAPGHPEVSPPPDVAARTMTRRGGDPVANTVSDVRAILGGPSVLAPKIVATGIALAVLAGIFFTYEQKSSAVQKSGAIKDRPSQSPPRAASEANKSSTSPTRERVNKPTDVPSLFTRIRGTLMGFGLTENDLFNTLWSAETTTQDPKLEQEDSNGHVRFYRQDCVVQPCGAAAEVLLTTKGGRVAVTSSGVPGCNVNVVSSGALITCPAAIFDLKWNGRQFVGTETVCYEWATDGATCRTSYLADARLTRVN